MKNHDSHIESLIEQFMLGETSLEQERELSQYFANSTSIPEEWEAYRNMFAYFDAGMPVESEKPKRNIARPVWALIAAAAMAAIIFLVAPHLQRTPTSKTYTPQPITTENENKTKRDTIVTTNLTQASPLIAKKERKTTKESPHVALKHHFAPDSIEIEREKGEVEQAQQELMAEKFIIEQERQEILDEQYYSRVQQQALQNENPQFIQVVFK
ncbi:MAG: hypothetical protein J5629_12225 [Muribaculaceae bacterium]|nr:hypothetical protein [Muribaculaceae bacterium]